MNLDMIAHICHEANRVYCEHIGDTSHPTWEDAPDWQRDSARNGVLFHLSNPDASVRALHRNWMEKKFADGWIYGPVKDPTARTHPCLVPYNELPLEQQQKDKLFSAIISAFRDSDLV